MKSVKFILMSLLVLAITFGGGTYYGYQMPRSGVDPQDYIKTVITPYDDGTASYIAFLDKAQKSVHIAAYSFTHDDITAKLIELKTKRNVLVRVLLDQSQSGGPDQKEQIEKLKDTLSTEARDAWEKASEIERSMLAYKWVGAAFWSKAPPPVSEATLKEFFKTRDATVRE